MQSIIILECILYLPNGNHFFSHVISIEQSAKYQSINCYDIFPWYIYDLLNIPDTWINLLFIYWKSIYLHRKYHLIKLRYKLHELHNKQTIFTPPLFIPLTFSYSNFFHKSSPSLLPLLAELGIWYFFVYFCQMKSEFRNFVKFLLLFVVQCHFYFLLLEPKSHFFFLFFVLLIKSTHLQRADRIKRKSNRRMARGNQREIQRERGAKRAEKNKHAGSADHDGSIIFIDLIILIKANFSGP